MEIRNLEMEDAPQVAELIKQLTPNIKMPRNLVHRLEEMAHPRNYRYLVAVVDGKVVGFGGMAWYMIPSKGFIGWIEEMVVENEYQGQGIGRKIMEELIQLAKDKGCKMVKLTSANPIARGLYESVGFELKDESKLMRLDLSE